MKKGPKFKRKSSTRAKFLKKRRLKKTPKGKQIAHKKSLWKGGTDSLRNLILKKKKAHKKQTAKEAREKVRRRKKK